MDKPLKVLIVDDSEDDAILLARHLRASGWDPDFARVDTREALEAALEENRWEVVFCDYNMPQLSVQAAILLIRQHDRDLPVIVVTGFMGEDELISLIKLGARDIVLKSNLARLRPAIERELAEVQLRREKAKAEVGLVNAIESIAEGVALYDAEDVLVLCNEKYRELLPRGRTHIVPGTSFEEIVRAGVNNGQFSVAEIDSEAFVTERLNRRTNPGQSFEQQQADGVWLRIEERRTIDDGVISVLTDITERKKLDSMKDEFVSVVGHELRTPLTCIKGALGLLESKVTGALPAEARDMIEIAHNNSDRLVRLINDILDIQKVESGKMPFEMQLLKVKDLLEQAIESNAAYAEQFDVRLELHGISDTAMIMADPDRMMQVATNLLSNAVKYAPPGTAITLGMQPREGMVRIFVADRGPGIPAEFQDRIFEKFEQADSSDTRQKGGTGLGLSIAKAIVERHGGIIGFETVEGEGTTFFFDLPAWESGTRRSRPAMAEERPAVLVCVHDRDTRAELRQMMAPLGYDVTTCGTASAAKKRLSQKSFSAMALDIALPGGEGIDLVQDVREAPETKDLAIIAITAPPGSKDGQPGGSAFRIADWLDKPIEPGRLRREIEQAMRMSRGRRPRILHVEDDPDHLSIVSEVVGDLGEIDAARTREAAIALLERHDYDLVILDLLLPDARGESLLPCLFANGLSAPPVLIYSVKDVPRSLLTHVAGSLVKSKASNEQLKSQIQEILETGTAQRSLVKCA